MYLRRYIDNHGGNDIDDLLPLKPEFCEEDHGRYVVRLLRAAYESDCLNIALSGPYGCGKSSILQEFSRVSRRSNKKVICISLSTLNPDQIPESSELTGFLEREILGQLLYQGDSNKACLSSVRGIHRDNWLRTLGASALCGFLLVLTICFCAFVLDNSPDKLSAWTRYWAWALSAERLPLTVGIIGLVILASICLVCLINYFLPSHIRIKSVSTGPASLTTETKEPSFFNKYRDELVYYFEINQPDAVIFEDLDRFNNSYIYEELRNLNHIINCAPGIHRSVSFIYAVRESLFDEASYAETSISPNDERPVLFGIKGSMKTKLFDLLISVVPFMADYTAYDVALSVFSDQVNWIRDNAGAEAERFDELLRLAAPYLSDMRLLKSIRNDYLILYEELGFTSASNGARRLGLTEDKLLAMAIYKNVYPLEYENLRIGKGSLYLIAYSFDRAVSNRSKKLEAMRSVCKEYSDNGKLGTSALTSLGLGLDTSIRNYIKGGYVLVIDGSRFDCQNGASQIQTDAFWDLFLKKKPSDIVAIDPPRYGSSFIRFTKSELVNLFIKANTSLDIDLLMAVDDKGFCLNAIDAEIGRCKSFDFSTFFSEGCIDYSNEEKTVTFRDLVYRQIGPGIAFDMLEQGFICRDFYLYISKYPNNASPNVVYFFNSRYRQNIPDLTMKLSEEDCRELCRIIPASRLSEHRCFNTDLLIFLLNEKGHEKDARRMIRAASSNKDSIGYCLLQSVLQSNKDRWWKTNFIALLMEYAPSAIDIMVDRSSPYLESNHNDLYTSITDYELKTNSDFLINIVTRGLNNFNTRITYTHEKCTSWLVEHASELLEGLSSFDRSVSDAVCNYFSEIGAEVHDLSALNQNYLQSAIKEGIYTITRNNLIIASNSKSFSSIDKAGAFVRDRVLKDANSLNEYLSLMEDGDCFCENMTVALEQSIYNLLARDSSFCSLPSIKKTTEKIICSSRIREFTVDLYSAFYTTIDNRSFPVFAAFCSSLIDSHLIESSLSNYIIVKKIIGKDVPFITSRSLASCFSSSETVIIGANYEPDKQDLIDFVNDMLNSGCFSVNSYLTLLKSVSALLPDLFPLDFTSISEDFINNPDIILPVFKDGLIVPGESVYNALKHASWSSYRMIVLKKMNSERECWSSLPDFLPVDMHRVLTQKIWDGGLLKDELVHNWRPILRQVCKSNKEYLNWEGKIEADYYR